MRSLPLHPAILIPLYVVLVAFLSAGISGWIPIEAGFAGAIAALWLQLAWTMQVVAFVASLKRFPTGASYPLLMSGIFAAVNVAAVGGLATIWFAGNPAAAGFNQAALLAFVASFMACLWVGARRLCFAEGRATLPTFLLFLYIAIGAPFIYRRLKNLAAHPALS